MRDVVLAESGVPDLARGRRPVVPPFARMTGTQGAVEVDFSVGASGTTNVQSVKGPDLLKPAAEQTVASWIFRRTKVDRLYLVAVFNYDGRQGHGPGEAAASGYRDSLTGRPPPEIPTP